MQADTNNCNYPVITWLFIVLNPDKQSSLVELCSHERTVIPKHVIEQQHHSFSQYLRIELCYKVFVHK